MAPRSKIRSLLLRVGFCAIGFFLLVPATASATLITGPGDPALAGALVQDFNSEPTATFFTSRTFLIGTDGFTVMPLSGDLHLDDQFCASFGTSGNCLDTINSSNQANDDFDVVFTGAGVSAFGFAINALDVAWTIETFDLNDNLLSTYTLASQSPGLSGFARRGYFGATESLAIQYFTVRSAGNDRALIDDFSYVVVAVPEPNAGMLLGLGLLTLAGSRFRSQSAAPVPMGSISTGSSSPLSPLS